MSRPLEDPELLRRLATGDRDALAELFALHRERLRRMIRYRLHPRLDRRVDVDDVLQEAWLDAVRRIDSYRDQIDPSGFLWLRLVVGQTMIDLFRKHIGAQMRDANLEVPLSPAAGPQMSSGAVSAWLSASITSPSGAAQRLELAELLRRRLDDLDPIDREVLVLRHLEELGNTEVAQILGIQPSAASNRYVRALARLKGLLSGLADPGPQDRGGRG
ncbi:MAG: sigma-70 family RNA polymerase sigma factor [Planctomycetes bacterium]|nr:sigma-70 family RNA polymerase sigma factor [Planctomycetota bacterium]